MYYILWETISGEKRWERFSSESLLEAKLARLRAMSSIIEIHVFSGNYEIHEVE